MLLQICAERHGLKAKITLDTVEIGNIVKRKEGHGSFRQWRFWEHGFHDSRTDADEWRRSWDFGPTFLHGMKQGVHNLSKGVVFRSTNGVDFADCTCWIFEDLDDDGNDILYVDGLEFDLSATN